MVLDWVVDDGVPNRGHRDIVYTPSFKIPGVRVGPHFHYGAMTALDVCNGFAPNPNDIKEREKRGVRKVDPKSIPQDKKTDTHWQNLGTCMGCGEQIKGGSVSETDRGKFHADCFACGSCKKNLAGTTFKVHEKKEYCIECYNKEFAKKCEVCNEPLIGTYTIMNDKCYHKECVTHRKDSKRCAFCNDPLVGTYSIVDNKNYHKECVGKMDKKIEKRYIRRCELCDDPIEGKYAIVNDKKYHKECADKVENKGTERCGFCDEPIGGSYAMVNDKKYHKECVNKVENKGGGGQPAGVQILGRQEENQPKVSPRCCFA